MCAITRHVLKRPLSRRYLFLIPRFPCLNIARSVRACGANRVAGARGVCGAADELRIARAALHFWEEPPISGNVGSGAVFFSNCPLHCVYCQNEPIANGSCGVDVSVRRLARIFLELQDQGALNVNLVTPTHYVPQIIEAAKLAREAGLTIPFVYNTSGYETPETIALLKGSSIPIWSIFAISMPRRRAAIRKRQCTLNSLWLRSMRW